MPIKYKEVEINEADLLATGLPRRYLTMHLNSDLALKEVATPIINYCTRISQAHGEGLGVLLIGPSPCGRTFWLSYLLRYALFKFGAGKTIRYVTVSDLTGLAFSEDSEKYDELREADFLAIDDIDAGTNSGGVAVLQRVFRERQKNGHITFLGIGCTEQEFKVLFQPATWRQINTDMLRVDCPSIAEKVATISKEKVRQFQEGA